MKILMNIERLKGWNRTKPKSVSGIQRSIFRISLQQSKSYLRLLQCVTPLVKLVTACVSSCASRGETESQASSPHSPICCSVTFPKEWHFISRQHTRMRGGTPTSNPSASPLPPNLVPELFPAALLSCCGSLSLPRPLASGV